MSTLSLATAAETRFREALGPLVTVYGLPVEVEEGRWIVPRSERTDGGAASLDWNKLTDAMAAAGWSGAAIEPLIAYIATRLRSKSPYTVENDFGTLLCLARWWMSYQRPPELPEKPVPFTWTDLLVWDATAFRDRIAAGSGNDFSRLRTFYRWAAGGDLEGFSLEVLAQLDAEVAPGNVKGAAVRHRIPGKGPLNDDERTLLVRALRENAGTDEDRALVKLLLERGSNPLALVLLHNRHLSRVDTSAGAFYQLSVPRIKKGQYRPAGPSRRKRVPKRGTRTFPISESLGVLLERLQAGGPDDPLLHWLAGKTLTASIREALKRWARDAGLRDPATGRLIRLTPRRLRYALATHAHANGASLYAIAALLDHSDTQNVRVYAQTSPGIADTAAAATDDALRPLVARFLGQVIESLDSEIVPGQPNQVLPGIVTHLAGLHLSLGGIGACGIDLRKERPCSLMPPLTCYPCPRFAALASGPHEQVLEELERYVAKNPAGMDAIILAQLEQTLTPLRELVRRLRARRQEAPE